MKAKAPFELLSVSLVLILSGTAAANRLNSVSPVQIGEKTEVSVMENTSVTAAEVAIDRELGMSSRYTPPIGSDPGCGRYWPQNGAFFASDGTEYVMENPRCTLECVPNEGEPECYDGYDDTYNSGCLYPEGIFLPLSLGSTVCGLSGTYTPPGYPFTVPAIDYYEITLAEDTEVTITVRTEFMANMGLGAPHPTLSCQGPEQDIALLEWIEPCQEASIVECLPPGVYTLGINPTFAHNIPCDVKYELSVTGIPCTASVPENDDYKDAMELPIPSSITADLLFANPDSVPECEVTNTGVGVWYKVVGTGNRITATTCGAGTDADTNVTVFCQNGISPFCIGGNNWDQDCSFRGSSVTWCSEVGADYRILVTGTGAATNYEFSVFDDETPCDNPASCGACNLTCEPGDIAEGEPTCNSGYEDTYNGGCNAGIPSFQTIIPGQTICGTTGKFFKDMPTMDYDWYEVTVTEDTFLTWTVQANAPMAAALYDAREGCANPIQLDSATAPYCQYATVSACVGAGTYWLTVNPTYGNETVPCGEEYRATLTAESCALPRGACCDPDGSCENATQTACEDELNGIYHGDGTSCDQTECTIYAAADTCEEAILLEIPSTTLGTNRVANYDNPRMCGEFTPSRGVWFKVNGTGNTITATTYGASPDFASKLAVYCGGCEVTRCVDADMSGCPMMNPMASPNTVTFCSEQGTEYLILVDDCNGVGDFQIELSEDSTACFDPPICEPCTADSSITAPGTWTGTTCGNGDDCTAIQSSFEDYTYEVEIPYDGDWVISLCGSPAVSQFGLGTTCCSNDIAKVEPNQTCQRPEFSGYLTAGVYYLSIDGYGFMNGCGEYILNIYDASETCNLSCPAYGTPEIEVCGNRINDGCEMQYPAFEPISNGGTVCGTFMSDDSIHFNDWYEIVLTERAIITWSVSSETYTLVGMLESNMPGVPSCGVLTGQLNPATITGKCQSDVILKTGVLQPGSYLFLIGPWNLNEPCEQHYTATVSWEPPPSGACCLNGGDCQANLMESECTDLGGQYQGVGTTCEETACEPFYCDASGMCGKYISNVQIAEIDNSSECGSYSDYTNETATMVIGEEYTATVTVPMAMDFMHTATIWVDWNHDYTFDDFGETYPLTAPPDQIETFCTTTIAPPAGTAPGFTRMRVRLEWGQERLACADDWSNGEVEDYTVFVTSPVCGDLDGDSDVDYDDYAVFLDAFGGATDGDPIQDYICDYDHTGAVGLTDYASWLECYRQFVGDPTAAPPSAPQDDTPRMIRVLPVDRTPEPIQARPSAGIRSGLELPSTPARKSR